MSETTSTFPDQSEKQIESVNNSTQSLRELLETKLEDKNISTEEAIIIQEKLKDVLIKTSDTRKEWRALSYNLRTEFQKAIKTKVDGAIWPWTIEALEKMTLQWEIEKINEVTSLANTSAEISENILTTRNDINNLWLELSEIDQQNIEVIKDQDGFQLQTFDLFTLNDNWVWLNGDKFWEDTWKTFWFWLESKFWIWKDNYKINSEINHYTTWEWMVYDELWSRDWWATDFSKTIRLDQFIIWLEKELMNLEWDDNSYVKISAWWGFQVIWDFWMSGIQKVWHEKTGKYKHSGGVESDTDWKEITWITPYFSATAEAEKQLFWNGRNGIFAVAEVKAMVAADWNIWENRLMWKAGIRGEYEKYSAEVTLQHISGSWVNASSSIHSGIEQWNFMNTTISTKLPFLDNSQIYYNLKKDLSWNNNQMRIWYKYSF